MNDKRDELTAIDCLRTIQMKQTNKLQKSYSQDWVVEIEKRQERKQSKLMRELKRNRKMQWVEGV